MSRAEAIADRNGIDAIAVRLRLAMKTRKRKRWSGRKTAETETDRDERNRASRAPAARLGNQAVGKLLRAVDESHAADSRGREAVNAHGRLDDDVARAIHQRRGRGRPLSDTVRREAESAFDADFGRVRVHTDEHADALAQRLQAEAFTVGSDIFLGDGRYPLDPSRRERVLVHELAHVVQQSGARATTARSVSDATDECEREAEAAEERVLSTSSGGSPRPRGALTRANQLEVRRRGARRPPEDVEGMFSNGGIPDGE